MSAPDWLTARPVAHRGLHDRAAGIIENSASAVRAARDAGYAIEVDIQETADGDAVVFHDEALDRLTGATGAVLDCRREELEKTLLKGSDEAILSVQEMLEIVDGAVPLIVEIKTAPKSSSAFAARAVQQFDGYDGPLAFQSFNPHYVADARRLGPKGALCGLISYAYADDKAKARLSPKRRLSLRMLLPALSLKPDFIAYDCRALPALAPRVARRVFGLPVLSWTVRSDNEARRIAPYVDQIIFEDFSPEN